MTPEIARRLGNPFMTRNLSLRRTELEAFVDHPVEFLKGSHLEPKRRRARGVGAHIHAPCHRPRVAHTRQRSAEHCLPHHTGTSLSEISKELEAMNGSLTLLTPGAERDRWVFRHPTIGDAYASLVAESPEQVELYVSGASLDRLFVEVVCGPSRPPGSKVARRRRPLPGADPANDKAQARWSDDGLPIDEMRCGFPPCLRRIFTRKRWRSVRNWARNSAIIPQSTFWPRCTGPSACPKTCVAMQLNVSPNARCCGWMSASSSIPNVRSLLTECEYRDLHSRFRVEWIDDLAASWSRIRFEIRLEPPAQPFP